MSETLGYIHSVETFGLVDGPGAKLRLMLSLLLRQPFEEESLRSDFIDFCAFVTTMNWIFNFHSSLIVVITTCFV